MAADAKAELREAMKARRAGLDADQRRRGERQVAARGVEWAGTPATIVSSYWAMGAEFDPSPLERVLRQQGRQIALPVMTGRRDPLTFRLWTEGDPLVDRMWGIREPLPSAPVVEPDLLLVPLLAFDAHGWRLGYGGGYYDRTLRGLRARQPVLAVGLAFDEQRIDAVPHLDYDERLDWVLTPSGPIRCSD